MGRPSLPVGTAGSVTVNPVATGGYEARCRFRDYDGVTRPVERRGKSRQAARAALNEHLRERRRLGGEGDITRDSLFRSVADLWITRVEERVDAGTRSPGTLKNYRGSLSNHVLPALGSLRMHEVTVGRVDNLLKGIQSKKGTAAAQHARAAISGVLGMAARHDAIDRNPARDAEPIAVDAPKKAARAMTLDEVSLLRGKLVADEKAVRRDLPDLVDFMLATGLRIGEVAAVTWDVVDLAAGTVEVRGTVVRTAGKGLWIKPKPKSISGYRTLELSRWAIDMLAMRKAVRDENQWGVLFTAPKGGLLAPGNVTGDLKEALESRVENEDGELIWPVFDWVTSHTFRKTVITLMHLAGLPDRAVADQAGHAQVSMTQNVYFGRKVVRTGAAAVLEQIGTPK